MVTTVASLRERIERAVLQDLEVLSYLRTRRPYEGELAGGELADEIRRQLVSQTPAVLVHTGPGKYEPEQMQRRRYTKELELRVLVAARSFRSTLSTKHGEPGAAAGQVGVYRMMEDIADRLSGWDCGLDGVGELLARDEGPVVQERDLSVWVLTFTVECDVTAPDRALAGAVTLTDMVASVGPSEAEGIIAQGTGDSFSVAGGTVTLVDAGAAFLVGAGWVGLRVRIEGAYSPGNNHDFLITAVPSGTQLQFTNPEATPETFAGTWKVLAPVPVTASSEVTP
jgi:phage gp37-like protein